MNWCRNERDDPLMLGEETRELLETSIVMINRDDDQ
jgi:hypothetical protein